MSAPDKTLAITTTDVVNISMPSDNGPGKPMPLPEFKAAVLENYRQAGCQRKTLNSVRRIFVSLESGLGVRTTAELDDPNIVDRFKKLDSNSGFAVVTQRVHLGTFRTIVVRGRSMGLLSARWPLPQIPDTRTAKWKKHFPRSDRTAPPSILDVQRLLDRLAMDQTWEGRRLRALVATIALSGIRLKSALGLRLSDVDLAASAIRILPRHRTQVRLMRISHELREVLEAWLRFRPQGPDWSNCPASRWRTSPLPAECDWVFPGKAGRGSWNERSSAYTENPRDSLKDACKEAGISPLTYEQLRRFCIEHGIPSVPITIAPPRVVLRGRHEAPIVDGKPQKPLTAPQHEVVQALLTISPGRLGKEELENQTNHSDARRILSRLVESSPEWAAVILWPSDSDRGYGIRR